MVTIELRTTIEFESPTAGKQRWVICQFYCPGLRSHCTAQWAYNASNSSPPERPESETVLQLKIWASLLTGLWIIPCFVLLLFVCLVGWRLSFVKTILIVW